ncbi:DUF2147 domain-containing protein [Chitinophagaceae bacterium MMS25-I14]
MRLHLLIRPVLLLLLALCYTNITFAQKDQAEGIWYNEEKTAKVQVFKATDNKFYGKIVWLKEPVRNGKPRTDENNSKEKLRSQPLMGLMVLKGFTKDGEKGYEDGTIYDPKNGKTYDCKMTYKGNTMDIRGYIGISLLGRTTVWTKAE